MSNNLKSRYERKTNHVNIYLTDSEKSIVDTVSNEHPDMALGSLFIYALMKTYGKALEGDYNAQLVKTLHDWKAQLNEDIEALSNDVRKKREQVCEIDMLLSELIKGEE